MHGANYTWILNHQTATSGNCPTLREAKITITAAAKQLLQDLLGKLA